MLNRASGLRFGGAPMQFNQLGISLAFKHAAGLQLAGSIAIADHPLIHQGRPPKGCRYPTPKREMPTPCVATTAPIVGSTRSRRFGLWGLAGRREMSRHGHRSIR